jgi:hypothetical protein
MSGKRLHGAGETFRGRVLKLSINFEEILSRASGKFEEENKFLESSIIIINYFSIISVDGMETRYGQKGPGIESR